MSFSHKLLFIFNVRRLLVILIDADGSILSNAVCKKTKNPGNITKTKIFFLPNKEQNASTFRGERGVKRCYCPSTLEENTHVYEFSGCAHAQADFPRFA